jgi:redox-sensitive bicupin YhaK (pirin superfamily)
MSWRKAIEPECKRQSGVVDLMIQPVTRDLGDFNVRRVLPSPERRLVGPFIFIDEMGPADFSPGKGMNVRPHPHIGLATVTYLFEGQILHRDSLGFVQPIEPGAVNLMTAGRGIVHSERTDPSLITQPRRLHGIQTWMALPIDQEEIAPSFEHLPADRLPQLEGRGLTGRLIIGEAFGNQSPVVVHARTLYLHVDLDLDAQMTLPDEEERAVYVVDGSVDIGGATLEAGKMGVIGEHATARVVARSPARIIVVGGEHLGHRHIWWNFVSSRRERIEQAKRDWRESRFDAVPGDDEFIPLPDDA